MKNSGVVAVTGDVANPTTLTIDDLRALPARTESVTYETSKGTRHHTYTGAALIDIARAAQPLVESAAKHALLRFAVVAVGADGYVGVVAWGEFDPEFAATPVLVAYVEDGKPVEHLQFVVPGDHDGGRYVDSVAELRVVDLCPR